MICKCERCKQERDCTFHGRPSDPEKNKAQSGEWLCGGCLEPRLNELDDAIANLSRMLEDGP